jgi:predicted 3-demethylubiquinone-9 3-methyltransferase (glyoxalase superfamily)
MAQIDTRETKATRREAGEGQKVTTYLTFKDAAEEAITLYTSLIPNSRIVSIMRSDTDGPIAKGKVLHALFELDGQRYMAMDGGESFSFSEGASLYIDCKTQQEVDELWEKLSAGGEKGPCGWLKDRFGLSWQVIPSALGEMISDPEHGNSQKVVEAMLKMSKIDIKKLEEAYAQK